MKFTEVLYEVDGEVALVTINRPEQRNALTETTLRELRSALTLAQDDAQVRAVVLSGSGEKAFSAGADLKGLFDAPTALAGHDSRNQFVELFLTTQRLGKPLIGCINGACLAGGFGLALCCDLLIASETATFGTPEIKVGLWPMMIMNIVVRNLGRKRAMELFMTGERISASQALEWGFVNRLVAPGELREKAIEQARALARWSPLVLKLGRDAFYSTDSMDFESALRHLHSQLTIVSLSDDFQEGVRAFLEKREPRFTGS